MAITWAQKRRMWYIGIFTIIIIFFTTLLIAPYFSKPATCTDGEQNGDEQGIDCGGSCITYCEALAFDPVVIWGRSFDSKNGSYTAAALVENQNINAFVDRLSYEFSLYDSESVFIARREGIGYLLPNGRTLIIESHIETGSRVPARTEFRYTPVNRWFQVQPWMQDVTNIRIDDRLLTEAETTPKYQAKIINAGSARYVDVYVGVVAYDATGNAVGVSATFIPVLEASEQQTITFTWNAPFENPAVRFDLIPMVDPVKR